MLPHTLVPGLVVPAHRAMLAQPCRASPACRWGGPGTTRWLGWAGTGPTPSRAIPCLGRTKISSLGLGRRASALMAIYTCMMHGHVSYTFICGVFGTYSHIVEWTIFVVQVRNFCLCVYTHTHTPLEEHKHYFLFFAAAKPPLR